MEGAVFLKKKRKKDLKGETPDRSGAGDRVPYREGGGDRGLQGRGGASWSFTMVAGAGLLIEGRGGGLKQVDIRSKTPQG